MITVAFPVPANQELLPLIRGCCCCCYGGRHTKSIRCLAAKVDVAKIAKLEQHVRRQRRVVISSSRRVGGGTLHVTTFEPFTSIPPNKRICPTDGFTVASGCDITRPRTTSYGVGADRPMTSAPTPMRPALTRSERVLGSTSDPETHHRLEI